MRGQLSQKPDLNNIEDGELPAPDDMDQGFPSPKLINRKQKASSPRDRKFEGKHRNDNVPGSHHYNHHDYTDDRNRMNRLGYMERDHKRHVPENHA
jgi:cyclin T